jgi:hypothetical protein
VRRTAVAAALVAVSLLACSSHGVSDPRSVGSSSETVSGSAPDDRSVPPAQAAQAPADPATPSGPTTDVPDSIAHDCSTDVTSSLNSLLAGLNDNSTIRFAPNGCYRIDDTLTLSGKHTILIDGQGAQLKAGTLGDQNRRHFTISASSDITIRNVTVVGSNDKAGATAEAYDPKLAFQHAFNLTSVKRVLLDTVISIVAGQRVLIADNSLTGVARSMFDIELNNASSTVRDVRITGNHTGPAVNFWLANKGAGSDIGAIEIDHNTMEAPTGGLVFAFGPETGLRGPWLFHDNQFIANDAVHDENSVGAFLFSNCGQITIANNHVTFPASGTMPAVELRSSKTVDITGNDFEGASQIVMADQATTDVTVN